MSKPEFKVGDWVTNPNFPGGAFVWKVSSDAAYVSLLCSVTRSVGQIRHALPHEIVLAKLGLPINLTEPERKAE